uniref:Uncharacterized protein n=1 Tax=viral metagenome TaxID=1070528 RepID=A0A6M3J4U5_9ZZZZ
MNGDTIKPARKILGQNVALLYGTLVAIWTGGWIGILVDSDHIIWAFWGHIEGRLPHLVAIYVACLICGSICAYICGLGLAKKILRK